MIIKDLSSYMNPTKCTITLIGSSYPWAGKLDLSVCGRLASGDAVCGGVSDVMEDKDESTSFTGATPSEDSISSKSRRLSRLEVAEARCWNINTNK